MSESFSLDVFASSSRPAQLRRRRSGLPRVMRTISLRQNWYASFWSWCLLQKLVQCRVDLPTASRGARPRSSVYPPRIVLVDKTRCHFPQDGYHEVLHCDGYVGRSGTGSFMMIGSHSRDGCATKTAMRVRRPRIRRGLHGVRSIGPIGFTLFTCCLRRLSSV